MHLDKVVPPHNESQARSLCELLEACGKIWIIVAPSREGHQTPRSRSTAEKNIALQDFANDNHCDNFTVIVKMY